MHQFPWAQLSFDTIRSICNELDLPEHSKDQCAQYLQVISDQGLAEGRVTIRKILGELSAFDLYKRQQGGRPPVDREAEESKIKEHTARVWNIPRVQRLDVPGRIYLDVRSNNWECDAWLKVFKARIMTADHVKAGSFTFRVVNMNILQDWVCDGNETMHGLFNLSERGGGELEGLGKSLFTEGGNPNPKFYQLEDGTTATFGPEIASGSFALLCGDEVGDGREYFHIEERYRRQGAGTQALRELFTNESLADVKWLFVWPSLNDFPLVLRKAPLATQAFSAITNFFQKAGFRRVGASRVMAYALHDDSHPSRGLPIDQDPIIPHVVQPTAGEVLAEMFGI